MGSHLLALKLAESQMQVASHEDLFRGLLHAELPHGHANPRPTLVAYRAHCESIGFPHDRILTIRLIRGETPGALVLAQPQPRLLSTQAEATLTDALAEVSSLGTVDADLDAAFMWYLRGGRQGLLESRLLIERWLQSETTETRGVLVQIAARTLLADILSAWVARHFNLSPDEDRRYVEVARKYCEDADALGVDCACVEKSWGLWHQAQAVMCERWDVRWLGKEWDAPARIGHLREALERYEAAMALAGEYYTPASNSIVIHQQLGDDIERSAASYERARQIDPYAPSAMINMAVALGRWKREQSRYGSLVARELLLRAVSLQPDNGFAHFNLANLYAIEGDVESMGRHLNRALASDDADFRERLVYDPDFRFAISQHLSVRTALQRYVRKAA